MTLSRVCSISHSKDQDDFEEKHLNEILQGTYELMMHHIKISNISLSDRPLPPVLTLFIAVRTR
ncbi:MAG: hypothetical protein MZV63_00930 [Marinilabiliales bacterium]|nr:hypothetical protein [Marinilabiliales bacterium]